MRLLIVALALLTVAHAPARAETLEVAEALYRQGSFEKAADLARALGSADGHALAARAMVVEAMWLAPQDEKLARLAIAAAHARDALELAPDHADAHLQLAISLGQAARLRNPVSVHLNGYVSDGKQHLEAALDLAPEWSWAHGMLGAWHLQVVGHAGPDLALELYGAKVQAGLELCGRAAELAPESIVPRFACALSLLELDRETYGRDAAQALALLIELPARDAAERLVQEQARRLLADGGGEATY